MSIFVTFTCLSYFSLPFMHHNGVVHLDPILGKYFPMRISIQNLHDICIQLRQTLTSKQHQKHLLFQNGGQYTNIQFAKTVTWSKFEKTVSQKNFSMQIWFKTGEYEQIYISEMAAKTISHIPNYANFCRFHFFHQKMRNWYLGN